MLAARWIGPGRIEPATLGEPAHGPGEALVEVDWCGICGSDLHAFRSEGMVAPGQVLGHELSGRVLDAPQVDHLAPGDRVVVRPVLACGSCARCIEGEVNLCERVVMLGFDVAGGMAERVVVPRATVPGSLIKVPAQTSLRAAALVEPLAVGMRAARLVEAVPADCGLVAGCGPIGLAVIHFLAAAGVQPLIASDPSPLRRNAALRLGATRAIDPTASAAPEALAEALGDRPALDFAVDCAGVESAVTEALRSVRRGGRVIVAARHGARRSISLDRISGNELQLLGSFAYRDELQRVLDLIASGTIQAEEMVTHEFGLEDIQEAFETQADAANAIKVLLRVGSEEKAA